MLVSALWFVGSMVGIIAVARFGLYEPAQKLARQPTSHGRRPGRCSATSPALQSW